MLILRPCIYFLIHGKKVVYVGQTSYLLSRLRQHMKDKKFSQVRYIECDHRMADHYESRWIIKFKPKFNKAIPRIIKSPYLYKKKGSHNKVSYDITEAPQKFDITHQMLLSVFAILKH